MIKKHTTLHNNHRNYNKITNTIFVGIFLCMCFVTLYRHDLFLGFVCCLLVDNLDAL